MRLAMREIDHIMLTDNLGPLNTMKTQPSQIFEGEEKKRTLGRKMQRNKSLLGSTISGLSKS